MCYPVTKPALEFLKRRPSTLSLGRQAAAFHANS
jgi:hypothetical protein